MKKYLLISEVAALLECNQTTLRYLEKAHSNIKISKIRGRRYYKASDIEKLAKIIGNPNKLAEDKEKFDAKTVIATNKAKAKSLNKKSNNSNSHELMIAPTHDLVEYDPKLPAIPDKHELAIINSNLPMIAEKHELAQLDMFSNIHPLVNQKQSIDISLKKNNGSEKNYYLELENCKTNLLNIKIKLESMLTI